MDVRLCSCGQPGTLLCDGKVMQMQDGTTHRFGRVLGSGVPRAAVTCDAPICKTCRTKFSDIHLHTSKGCRWDTLDLCPLCAATGKEQA